MDFRRRLGVGGRSLRYDGRGLWQGSRGGLGERHRPGWRAGRRFGRGSGRLRSNQTGDQRFEVAAGQVWGRARGARAGRWGYGRRNGRWRGLAAGGRVDDGRRHGHPRVVGGWLRRHMLRRLPVGWRGRYKRFGGERVRGECRRRTRAWRSGHLAGQGLRWRADDVCRRVVNRIRRCRCGGRHCGRIVVASRRFFGWRGIGQRRAWADVRCQTQAASGKLVEKSVLCHVSRPCSGKPPAGPG